MVFENVKRNDVVYGLTLTVAGAAVTRILPNAWESQLKIGSSLALATGVAFTFDAHWGGRKASVVTAGALGAYLLAFTLRELVDQPSKLFAAWREREVWGAIAAVRRLSFATGVLAPAAWSCWQMADGLVRDDKEARATQLHIGGYIIKLPLEVRLKDQITAAEKLADADFKQFKEDVEQLKKSEASKQEKQQEKQQELDRLKRMLSEWPLNFARAKDVLERFDGREGIDLQRVRDAVANWREFDGTEVAQVRAELDRLHFVHEEEEEEEAVDILMVMMKPNQYGLWEDALGLKKGHIFEMDTVLNEIGLKTRTDLDEANILVMPEDVQERLDVLKERAAQYGAEFKRLEKEDDDTFYVRKHRDETLVKKDNVRLLQITKALKEYRLEWEPATGAKAAILNYLAQPSSLKESMGPAALKALKVVGGVGYLAVWGACAGAHVWHAPRCFLAGGVIALIERAVCGHEVRIRHRDWTGQILRSDPRNRNPSGILFMLSLQAAMIGEEMQAGWLAGNDVRQVLNSDEPIQRDLLQRAATFGERGPVAQMRVVASETGLSGAYLLASQLAAHVVTKEWEADDRLPVGTLVVGRSCVHALCDTVVGLFQRGRSLIA